MVHKQNENSKNEIYQVVENDFEMKWVFKYKGSAMAF